MHATVTGRTSHLDLFTFHRLLKFPAHERNLSLARVAQCMLKVVSSLDPIPSGGGHFTAPHRAVTRRFSEVHVDYGHPTLHFLPPSRANQFSTVAPCIHTLCKSIKRSRPIPLVPPFGWRIRRTMSTTSSLSAYLLEQKTRFLGDDGNGWTVVMGNEAGGAPYPAASELLQS